MKGTLDDNVTEGKYWWKVIVVFNNWLCFLLQLTLFLVSSSIKTENCSLLGTREGGWWFFRWNIFQIPLLNYNFWLIFQRDAASKSSLPRRGEYNVYSTFQSHEPEFDYLKSLEIEEKINKIRWLRRKNPAHFLLSTNGIKTITFLAAKTCDKILFLDKTIKLWKVSERDKRAEGYNLKEDSGVIRDPSSITTLKVPVLKPMELMVEASMFC